MRHIYMKLAMKVAEDNNFTKFRSSSKWINGFFRRSLRRQSSLQLISDAQIMEKSVSFMRFLEAYPVSHPFVTKN